MEFQYETSYNFQKQDVEKDDLFIINWVTENALDFIKSSPIDISLLEIIKDEKTYHFTKKGNLITFSALFQSREDLYKIFIEYSKDISLEIVYNAKKVFLNEKNTEIFIQQFFTNKCGFVKTALLNRNNNLFLLSQNEMVQANMILFTVGVKKPGGIIRVAIRDGAQKISLFNPIRIDSHGFFRLLNCQ